MSFKLLMMPQFGYCPQRVFVVIFVWYAGIKRIIKSAQEKEDIYEIAGEKKV